MFPKLIALSALLCFVAADVSEVLNRPKGRIALKTVHLRPAAYKHKLRAREVDDGETNAQLFDTVIIEDNADLDHLDPIPLAVVDSSDVPPASAFQLHESHQDFQGPYHYEKPTIENDYLAPKPDGDYLPPHGPRDFDDSVAKRSIRLRLRPRH
ncbi:hypothetical protein RP20_CCG019228 [Aedes albopictus]|nr:uncharacterized protein LOC109428634 [Aedes albopictus]KXJ81519.1 hypothetical protein RP20_CCG019228 [Aedes albopictus]